MYSSSNARNNSIPDQWSAPGTTSVPQSQGASEQLPLFHSENALNCIGSISQPLRPIHYLGSKLRMVDAIVDAIDRVDPGKGRVCDLFAGSGTVAGVLARSRSVTAVDIQEYSRVLCSALIHPIAKTEFNALELSPARSSALRYATASVVQYEEECIGRALMGHSDMLNDFMENCSLIRFLSDEFTGSHTLRDILTETVAKLKEVGLEDSGSSLTTRMFGGVYFSYSQTVELDSLLDTAFSVPPPLTDLLVAAVLSTASEIVNTIGKQFAQPLRPRDKDGATKENLLHKIQSDRSADPLAIFTRWLGRYQRVMKSPLPHRVIKADYADALSMTGEDFSVVYADPPYTRDHYSRYYHVLETMALRDNPTVARVRVDGVERVSRGVYRADRHQSPFCIPSKVVPAFATLFALVANRRLPLILSYSPYSQGSGARPRLLTVDTLKSLAEKEFTNVTIEKVGPFSHSKLNATRLNKIRTQYAESLIICRP